MYKEGRAGFDKGPEADAEAVRYYCLAAAQGVAEAQGDLGRMYQEGRAGLEKGPEADAEAMRYYRLAAAQGYSPAKHYLGSLLLSENTKAIRQCPVVILQRTLSWSAKEIKMLVNAEELTGEMPEKLLLVLMDPENKDQLKFLPKDRGNFIKYVESMICVVGKESDLILRAQYKDCLQKCVEKRTATPSTRRGSGGLFSRLPSISSGPFQGTLDRVRNAAEADSVQASAVEYPSAAALDGPVLSAATLIPDTVSDALGVDSKDAGIEQFKNPDVVVAYPIAEHEIGDSIGMERFKEALDVYARSSRFFSATHPELDNLRGLLKSGGRVSRASIGEAITSARSSIGSKSHRINIFNDPNSNLNDTTGTSSVVRDLGFCFKRPNAPSLDEQSSTVVAEQVTSAINVQLLGLI
jgi:hypothetical protein